MFNITLSKPIRFILACVMCFMAMLPAKADKGPDKGEYIWGNTWCYTYQGSQQTMVENATIMFVFEGDNVHFRAFTNSYNEPLWAERNGKGKGTFTYTYKLSSSEVQTLAQNDYLLNIYAHYSELTSFSITAPTNNPNTGSNTEDNNGGSSSGNTDTPDDSTNNTPDDNNGGDNNSGSNTGSENTNTADRANAYGYAFTSQQLDSFPQITNLPTVYLNVNKTTYDSSTGSTSWNDFELEDLRTVFGTKNDWYYHCQIVIRDDNGTIEERNETVNMRGRGNATWDINQYKKPLRLKFPAKTALLGSDFAKEKNWTLLANFYDKSLIKNGLTYELGKYMNLPFSPAAKYVDLVVNGRYLGTYQISDKVEVASKRIPGTKTAVWLEANSAKRQGFAEEPCFYDYTFGSCLCINIKNPEVEDNTKQNNTFVNETLQSIKTTCETVINAVKNFDKDNNTTYRRYIDYTTAVDHFIALDITGNHDGDVANNYMYRELAETKLKFGPIWDSDLAWGSDQNMKGKHFWDGELFGFGAACKKIFENDPYFVKLLYERWEALYNNGALSTYLNNKVDELARNIAQSATLNYTPTNAGGAGWGIASEADWADGNIYNNLNDTYTVIKAFNTDHLRLLNKSYKDKYDQLGCKDFEIPDPEDEDEDPEIVTGLQDLGIGILWGGQEHVYSYTGNAQIMSENATMKIEIEGNGAYMDVFADDRYTAWIKTSGGSPLTYTRTLSSGDVTRLNNCGYIIKIAVYGGGTCKSVSFEGGAQPEPCQNHIWETDQTLWNKDNDGIYHRVCTKCQAIESDVNYYLFTIYPESAETQTLYATEWHPSDKLPNSIATVEVAQDIAAAIHGWNIVSSQKNVDGDLTCHELRLTDGHPFFSKNKFVAGTATYSRALTNAWGTLCLPFKTQEASTEYASFYHLDSYVDGSNGGAASLVFKPVEPLVSGNCSAYMPVVFKATNKAMEENKLEISWNDITVKKSTEPTTTTSESTGWTLNGTVKEDATARATTNSPVYYIAQNKFWYAEQEVKVSAFRAWYTVEAASTEAAPAACRIVITDETSSIDEIQPDDEQFFQAVPAPLYDLQGRPVSGTPTPGLYLRGSQKVLLR